MSALLLERHDWETSGSSHQVQIPKVAFAEFFDMLGEIDIRIWDPPTASTWQPARMMLSYYPDSDTYRINLLTELGLIGHAVLVFERTEEDGGEFDLWWFTGADATTALALPYAWQQAKSSQYGRGRFWTIIDGSAPRSMP